MRIVLMICVACGLLVAVGANLQRSIDIARISTLYGLLEPTSPTRPLDDPVFRERLDDLFETGSRLDQFMMLIGVTIMGISGAHPVKLCSVCRCIDKIMGGQN